MKKFILTAILLILTRYADVQTTYLHTPDLKKEANPMVSLLGLGWTGSIIIQIIAIAFLLYALWIYCFKNVEVKTYYENISITRFISLFHFNDTKSFKKMFYKMATNKNSLLYAVGFIMTYSLITIGILVSISTSFLIISEKYRGIYSAYKIPIFLYIMCIIIIVFWAWKFYNRERIKRVIL